MIAKKGLNILTTLLLVVCMSVSFSFCSEAATTVNNEALLYLGGVDGYWSVQGGDSGISILSQGMRANAFKTPDFSHDSWLVPCTSDLTVFLSSSIPANSRIYVSFSYSLYFFDASVNPWGEASGSLSLYSHNIDVGNPSVSLMDSSVSFSPVKSPFLGGRFYYNLCLDSSVVVNRLDFIKFSSDMEFIPYKANKYAMEIAFDYLSVTYEPINDNPNGDVLNKIEQNTNQTNQSINNQTNELTNGFDNSGLNADNNKLSGSLGEYDQAQGQVTDQSVGFIDGATFIDPTKNAGVLASITFTASWLQSLFVNIGDWSVLVVVSLSISFALMLVGWFKYRK